jgi:carboxypeptidase family protein
MKLLKSSAGFLLLLLFCVGATAQERNTASIKGKVKVERGSAAGVAVILIRDDQEVSRTATDKRGEFTLARIAPGTYSVKFRKPGLSIGTVDAVLLKSGQTRTFKDLFLGIDEGSIAFIRGSVFTDIGRSVPGVRVELTRILSEDSTEKLDSRITGETGEFVFRVPPDAAKYRLALKAQGAAPASKDVEVDGAAIYRVALTLKPNPK